MGQIQAKAQGSAATTSAAITLPGATTGSGANSLVFAIWKSISDAPLTIVDSAGGSLAGGQWVLRQGSFQWFIYDRIGCPSGITSVTATFGSSVYMAVVQERDDLVSFDKTASAEVGTSTAPSSGAVATTAFANEVALGFFATFTSGSNSYAAGSGWTALAGTGITAGHWPSGEGSEAFAETQVLVATGTPAATATCTSSYQYAAIVTYRQTVAAPSYNIDDDQVIDG